MSTKKDKTRVEFGLSSFSIENKTSVYVLIFIIVILGLMSYNNMPRESFPEIVQPTIYVNTAYPGNSPSDMENLVTRPIEKEIKTLKNVKKFTSTSIQDFSIIVVEFESDKDTKQALQEVKDKVDKAKKDLPNDLPVPPNVFEMDFSEFPVMNINLSGKFSYNEFKEYAEYLRDEIEKIPEISEVAIRGLLTKEVEISVDLPAMEAVKASFDDIEMAIRNENLSMSAGDILSISGTGLDRRSIRITGEFKNPIEMENIIVKNENQMPVYLRDIAKVSFGPVEPISFARMDGNAVVMLDVKKKSGENLINGAKKIREVLENAKKTKLPSNLSIIVTNDQSIDTEMMVSNLENNIISGVILVVLVLLFFLGIRNAIFVGVAIPLSMILGIFVLNFMGTTLNMMVLFSLILALGMLVDNGIVVVENIYRLRSEGHNKINASKFGVGEVAKPIISSTATTLAAFLPLLFWDSIIGEFMKYLPITLIITLSASLFVGLVVNPVLTANFIKISKRGERSDIKKFWRNTAILFGLGVLLFFAGGGMRILGNLLMVFALLSILFRFLLLPVSESFQYRLIPRIENRYKKFVHWALTRWRPYAIFVGTFFLLIFSTSFYFGSNPKTTFFPENDPKYVNVYIEMPLGKDIRQTDSITKVFEKRITEALEPNKAAVEAIIAQVGEGTSDPNSGPSLGASPHKARITVSFIKYEDRIKVTNVSTTQMMEDIRNAVQGFPEANVSVEKNSEGPPVGPPINIEIIGENYDTLIALSNRVKDYLTKANVPGVDRLKTDLELGKPETIVKINNEAARLYGISTYYIATALRTGLFGKEISKFKEGEDDYPIQLRLKNQYRYNIESLMNMRVTFRNQSNGQIVQIPISSVATIEQSSSYGSVKRKDMDRVISIFSNVQPGANANEIISEYKQLMTDFKMPDTYIYKFTGEQEEQNDSVAFMVQALLIAVFLIFLIIVTQFNSIISPFIIMFSVLFSTIGVFIGFGIFKMDFVFLMCGIGIISLAGVVVNNAIVLLDYTNLLRSRRREELGLEENEYLTLPDLIDTITEAGKTRLRPVLLTAITTVLGLIPLAIGLNINFITLLSNGDPQIFIGGDSVAFWGPMSWTVIFGLIFATFLTLVVVPVMYYLSDRLVILMKRILS
jgi:multidrug efflux pump subunit AcrB